MSRSMNHGGETIAPHACPRCGHMRLPAWCPECDAGKPEPEHPSLDADVTPPGESGEPAPAA